MQTKLITIRTPIGFSEWLTDNSWKESGSFSAAKQELQIKASAYTPQFLVWLKSCMHRRKFTHKTNEYRK